MIVHIFYLFNLLVLGGCLIFIRMKTRARRVTLSLIQILVALPLLSVQYYYFYTYFQPSEIIPLLFFTESTFALLWLSLVYRLASTPSMPDPEPRFVPIIQLGMLVGLLIMILYSHFFPPKMIYLEGKIHGKPYDLLYFYSLLLLAAMLASAWRLEVFWRTLAAGHRRAYRGVVVAGYLICGILAWAASYRATYLQLVPKHFLLLGVLLITAWCVICFTVAYHGLLYRKIIISRQIAYSFVAPTIFAVYMIALGAVGFIMKTFGWPLPFIIRGMVLALGIVALIYYICSPLLRRRVNIFINTHFYENKYVYKDEWKALSTRLQGVSTELDVARALYDVVGETVYSRNIIIWLGDGEWGYKPVYPEPASDEEAMEKLLKEDDLLIRYLSHESHFYLNDIKTDSEYLAVVKSRKEFMKSLDLVLMVPFFINQQLVGMISLGPEFIGGHYGYDDFDLLSALGTQAASTIVAVRMAKQSAEARERQAWDRLSAFVLHDVKNASAMLSLVRENAPTHIHKPKFQKDMLEAIDDSLARMGKVQQGLDTLKEETTPHNIELELKGFLDEYCLHMGKRLRGLSISLNCPSTVQFSTDPDIVSRILENLILNAYEASGEPPSVGIEIDVLQTKYQVVIQITDSGPGIDDDFLPEVLFEPFKTTKRKGSGIGLWQVRQLVQSLNGTIQASNVVWGGARFMIRFPS
jgi:putative PEP-CTERM system histidine kinase